MTESHLGLAMSNNDPAGAGGDASNGGGNNDDNNNNDNSNNDDAVGDAAVALALDPVRSPVLYAFWQQLEQLVQRSGYSGAFALDVQRARNSLDIAAGNMDMAIQFYWDDFLATQQQQLDQQQQQPAEDAGDNNNNNNDADVAAAAVGDPEAPHGNEMNDDDVQQPQQQQQHQNIIFMGDDDDDEEDDFDLTARRGRHSRRSRDSSRRRRQAAADAPVAAAAAPSLPSAVDDEQLHRMILRAQETRRLLQAAAAQDSAAAQSVSDDEGGSRRNSTGPPEDTPPAKCRKANRNSSSAAADADELDIDLGFLDEKDWLFDGLGDSWSSPAASDDTNNKGSSKGTPPTSLLWGISSPAVAPSSNNATFNAPADGGNGGGGNVIVVDDEDNNNNNNNPANNNNNDAGDPEEKDEAALKQLGIPATWLNASFSLSECATGLSIRPPKVNDPTYDIWKSISSKVRMPPPYHCKSVTALTAAVTALLYSGAQVQRGQIISCATNLTPFAELTAEERRRQFRHRLADALTCLLTIAARKSRDRKQKALEKLSQSSDATDQRKWQVLRRKLKFCPVCHWVGDVKAPSNNNNNNIQDDKDFYLSVSYTNIFDLKSYVLSSLRYFMAPGGVALFLETIVRIHGSGAVTRMIRNARTAAAVDSPSGDTAATTDQPMDESGDGGNNTSNSCSSKKSALICCKCTEQQAEQLQKNPPPTRSRAEVNKINDTSPDSTDCVSIELLSLILTGKVYSTWRGWSTHELGVGFLSDLSVAVGKGLTRPSQPVWILRGPSCFSVLTLDHTRDFPRRAEFGRVDKPASVASMLHWNCWYNGNKGTEADMSATSSLQRKVQFNMVMARPQWKPPAIYGDQKENHNTDANLPSCGGLKFMEAILKRQRERKLTPLDQLEAVVVAKSDSAPIQAHAEDQKLYPGKYRMWRYNVPGDDKFVAFHRLSDRHQELVHLQYGPEITAIMWSRWPHAVLEDFAPESGFPAV